MGVGYGAYGGVGERIGLGWLATRARRGPFVKREDRGGGGEGGGSMNTGR